MCSLPSLNWVESLGRLEELAEFSSSISAHSVRILLKSNGVKAMVSGDVMNESRLEFVSVYVHARWVEMA